MHSTANLPSSGISKKFKVFSKKKPSIFSKKTQISNVLRTFTNQAHSTVNLLQIGQQIFSRSVA